MSFKTGNMVHTGDVLLIEENGSGFVQGSVQCNTNELLRVEPLVNPIKPVGIYISINGEYNSLDSILQRLSYASEYLQQQAINRN